MTWIRHLILGNIFNCPSLAEYVFIDVPPKPSVWIRQCGVGQGLGAPLQSSSPLLLRGAPDTARILCRNFTPKHHRQLGVKNLPKVTYVAARAGVEPMTLRTTGVGSTNAPPTPHNFNGFGRILVHFNAFTTGSDLFWG